MNVYIEKLTDNGFEVIARGPIEEIAPEYKKQKDANEPVHLCIDCSGMEDMPDFADPLIKSVMGMLGVKVIDYDGTISQTEAYKQKIKEVFQDD